MEEEIDYLYEYAKIGLLYFVPLWDSAESLAGKSAPLVRVREVTLELIGALTDRGVRVGPLSHREDRLIEPWNLSREEILLRVAEELEQRSDPLDCIEICGFTA
ncbi:hypothetical protein JJV70_06000 [Streptomyces sp. JJ66]|uniref:hypothetical protein n=1 Tax=Streptomyces sp. JJ66 TaxID=2803843 RepID=UPI001C5997CA|nr:hypothetical protein [Streptomyces sp. JJ66]MBW1601670.1 hypothetical protein [Streptomyces sp. JJ66]